MNVGDIRKAIEALPDDAPVLCYWEHTEGSEGMATVEMKGVEPSVGGLIISVDVTVFGDADDFDLDEDDL